jgi:hypothetical protein
VFILRAYLLFTIEASPFQSHARMRKEEGWRWNGCPSRKTHPVIEPSYGVITVEADAKEMQHSDGPDLLSPGQQPVGRNIIMLSSLVRRNSRS